jgi:hypothetical protein
MDLDPGQAVTLTWATTGCVTATIEQWLPAGTADEFLSVPPSGTTTEAIEEYRRLYHEFRLVARNAAGQSVERSLTIELRCPYDYFFEPPPAPRWGATSSCPYKPAASPLAAEQFFEGGRAIWLEGLPAESSYSGAATGPKIYVLYYADGDPSHGPLDSFDDTWLPGEPESDPTIVPPDGLYQPIRGFGKLWRSNPEVRARLGWALALEQSFEGAWQIDWRPYYLTGETYLRASDGSLIVFGTMGGWEQAR